MGHFHATNISERIFHLFFMECFEHKKNEHGDVSVGSAKRVQPKPLPLKGLVDYLMARIEATTKVLEGLPESWGKSLLMDLIKHEWGVCASDGGYLDRGIIEDGIAQVISVWQQQNNLEQVLLGDAKKGYYFSREAIIHILNDKDGLTKYIIHEIET